MGSFLASHWVADTPAIFFEDESHPDVNRQRVRREQGGLWQRAGYESYMTDDEWESLEGDESKRLENEYQRLIKAGEAEDIDLLPERPRWIPVSERLPEKDVDVLVFTDGWDDARLHVASFGDYGEWNPSAGDGYDFPKVTHWMPLPAPPAD